VTQPRRHHAFPIALLLAALAVAACGGDITLPEEGEAASIEVVDGDQQVGPAGAVLAKQLVVRVEDTQGRPVPGQDVTFVIESGGGSVAPGSVTTNSAGLAAADWTLGPSAGDQLLRARTPRGGSSELLEVPFRATAVAGSGSVLAMVDGDEQTGPVSSALADSLVVRATDALGNPVANVEVAWSVSGGGSISPVTVLTGTDGLAAAERVLGPASGAQSAQAAVDGFSGSPVTFTHTAVPANPTVLVMVSGDDQIAPGGFEVPADLVVRLEDDNGNGIGGRPITWVVPAGSGSVNPVNTTTDPNGRATTRWTLPSRVGGYTVNAVFSGLPPVVFSATATADVPTTIELVSGNNQTAPVGAALANPLVVRVTDASDNPVAGVSVNWTAVDGGSVGGATSGTDASGLAEMTRTLGTAIGQYTTTAAVDGLAGSPVTFTSTATVGPPTQLAITRQPGSPTVSGNVFSPVPIVQIQDAFGNPVALGGITVTAAITSGQAGASLTNEERNTNSSGVATFNNLRISGPPDDDYVLTFTASVGGTALSSASSVPLTVTAGSATRLVVVQQPSTTVESGVVFPQQPIVQVVDATGNPVNGNRTIEVELGVGTGTLSGTLTASTGSGSTATFTDLRITGAAGTKTLLFSSGALTPAESESITLINSAPTAQADAYSVDEDGTLAVDASSGVLQNDDDPNNDVLTAELESGPANALSFSLNSDGSFTYTPQPDFNGSDSFTYHASDGQANSNTVTVTITVNSVNDEPGFTAGPDVSTSSLVSSVLGATHAGWGTGISPGPPDESSQTVEFELTLSPADSAAFETSPQIDAAGTLTYRPALRLDTIVISVTVVARDSQGAASGPQTFSITITP
jgi:hypothetical protein